MPTGDEVPGEGTLPASPPVAYAAAAASGALYWLAFPGVDAWPLTFVALVPLILAMHKQPTHRAMRLGWTAGLVMNVAGFIWLQKMLQTFSGFPLPVCFLFVLLVCAYQGGRMALLGWVFGRATKRGWPAAPVFAGAFVLSELTFPVLFPWYYAATVHDQPALMQVADAGGPILVGLVLVAVNLAVAEPFLARGEKRPVERRVVFIGTAGLAITCAYGFLRVREVDATARAAPAATVGVVQADMGLIEKRTEFNEGLRRHLRISEELKGRGADFLVWSETSAMGEVGDESYRTDLRALSSRIGVPAIFGAVIVRLVADERQYILYNSAISSDKEGVVNGRYDKEYLLTFGEYLPFGEQFPILHQWSPNSGHFSPGTSFDPLIVDIQGQKHLVTALICYEDILPRFTNDAVRHGNPELLVNLTNDAWFGDTAEPWEHLALAQLRAVEHHRYLVRGTNSGVSAVVDPAGRVIAKTQTFRQEGLISSIHWMRSHTMYERVGDWPWLIVACTALFAAFRRRPRRVLSA